MLCAALLRHEGCPQRGLGPLGRRFITDMSGRFLSTVDFPDSNRLQTLSVRFQPAAPGWFRRITGSGYGAGQSL